MKCNYLDPVRRDECGPAVVKTFYKQTNREVFLCERCWANSARLMSNRYRVYESLEDNTRLVLEFLVQWARQVRSLA